MKKFVVVLLFSKNNDKVLMVKRNKKPYKDCWNGIGGKLEVAETPIEAAIRECKEETNIDLKEPKHFITYQYPDDNPINSGTILHVVYDFIDMVDVSDNEEGHYEWKNIDFVLDFSNQEIAGFSNVSQFVKEIFDLEGIQKFYSQTDNKVYNKLVRDKIPEIMMQNGAKPITRVLTDEEYLASLNQKLQEELKEYLQDGSVEELADLQEVLFAILDQKNISRDEFENIRKQKVLKRGSFSKKIFLEREE